MNKTILAHRLLAGADLFKKVMESKTMERAIRAFLWFAAGFFGKVIIDIVCR